MPSDDSKPLNSWRSRSNKSRTTQGASAVVTGAGRGIGRAFALELVARGSRVVCSDLDLEAAEDTVREAARRGGHAVATRCDVTREDDVRALARTSADWFGGPPDLVVLNAGIGTGGARVGDTSLEDWRRTVDVNLWGVIYGCHVFTPGLRGLGRGGLVLVASAAAFSAAPRMAAYNVTKAGVLALGETLAAELVGTGVHVAVVCPTFVKTDIVKSGRLTEGASRIAGQLMERTGVPPERIARASLDALDAGELYVVPQLDGRVVWRTKRVAPALYARIAGLVERALDRDTKGGST